LKATIKDIAKLSGVGIATVSRVLNGSGAASKEAKERVMDAVRELNYIPNSNARNLKLGQSRTILLLAKSIINPFFQKMIYVIERQISLRGYSLEIKNVSHMDEEMIVAQREAQNGNLCGIIIMGGRYGYKEEDFKRLRIPCVLVTITADESVGKELYSSVIIDDQKESRKAVESLIKMGHRRIGCIYNNYGSLVTPNYYRLQGYKQALEENDIRYDPGLVSTINVMESGYEFGFKIMKNILEQNRDMSAVIAMADVMAIGAAKAVLSSGLRIPEDISVMGFDGIEEAEYYNPALDSVGQPAQQMAQQAVDAMMEMIGSGTTSQIVLETNIIRRGSCAKVNR